ncbi:MAG: hypothetical protein ACMUHX_03195 [bacterium]
MERSRKRRRPRPARTKLRLDHVLTGSLIILPVRSLSQNSCFSSAAELPPQPLAPRMKNAIIAAQKKLKPIVMAIS